eukprot:ctg_1223.g405
MAPHDACRKSYEERRQELQGLLQLRQESQALLRMLEQLVERFTVATEAGALSAEAAAAWRGAAATTAEPEPNS